MADTRDELVVVPLSSLLAKVCACADCESDGPPWPDPPHPATPVVDYEPLSGVLANLRADAKADGWDVGHAACSCSALSLKHRCRNPFRNQQGA